MSCERSAGVRCVAGVIGLMIWGTVIAPDTAAAVCVLTCPPNIALTTLSIEGAPVTYALPGQTGCTGTVEQAQGLPSGSTFPPGTTTNSFFDSVSTGSTCSFTVTVKFLPQNGAPAVGPFGLAALAACLAGLGAWATRRRLRTRNA